MPASNSTRAQHRKACRLRLGLTQEQAAERCGVSSVTFRQVENDEGQPYFSTVEKVAIGLGYGIDAYAAPTPEFDPASETADPVEASR